MNSLIFRILKYLAIGMAIYIVFRFVPNIQLESSDILLISMVSIFIVLLLDTLCSSYDISEGMTSMQKNAMCNSVCDTKEPMTTINAPEQGSSPISEIKPPVLPPVKPQENKDIYDYQTVLRKLEQEGVEQTGSRVTDGTLDDESKYTSYHQLPLPDDYDKDTFEYGDSFLPPEKWYPQPPIPPICVAEKKSSVYPMYTTGTPIDVKEWNNSRRITGPAGINTKYIKEKLNSGR